MSRFHSIDEYRDWLDQLPASAYQPDNGADTLVTYSGRERQNAELAQRAVAADPANKYTIEQTPMGRALSQDNLWAADGPLKRQEAHEVWRYASEKMVQNAKASKMETFVTDAPPRGIFRGTELANALANPTIKTINDVPAEKHMAQYDPEKIYENVVEAELALREQRLAHTNNADERQALEDCKQAHASWKKRTSDQQWADAPPYTKIPDPPESPSEDTSKKKGRSK